jgi:glucose/arabinose dehydrogenase
MRTISRPGGRTLRSFAGVLSALALVAACAGSTSTASPTGLASVAPPETASPTPGPTSTPVPTPVPSPTPFSTVQISLAKVATGLAGSIGVENAGDERLFVIGQPGRIYVVRGGAIVSTFLDISGRISSGGERGLLGLAFHPDYASNGRFFVRYTDKKGNVQISEFHVSSDPNKADPASEKKLITIAHPTWANHNGGRIAFGPDGFLYVPTGDGGGSGDPRGNGQNLKVLLGKLLRLDVDHASGSVNYSIPADNPFAGQTGKWGEIWAYGLRNPYMFSFDRQTGDLWIADVGQNKWEEVDRSTVASGGGRGLNYGWSIMEARHCYKPATGCKTAGITLPIAEYDHGSNDSTGCSIIGGSVYRGSAHPDLVGRYFFGDYCSGKIWDLQADGPDSQTPQFLLASGLKIMGWGEGSDGEIYLVSQNGVLYHLT